MTLLYMLHLAFFLPTGVEITEKYCQIGDLRFLLEAAIMRERKKEVTNEWGKILLMMSLLIMCQSCASYKRTVIFVTVFYTNTTRFWVHVYT